MSKHRYALIACNAQLCVPGIQTIFTCLESPFQKSCLPVVWAIAVLLSSPATLAQHTCEDKARKCQHTEDEHQVQLGHVTTACTEDERDCAGTSSKDKYISKCTGALLARKEICKNCLVGALIDCSTNSHENVEDQRTPAPLCRVSYPFTEDSKSKESDGTYEHYWAFAKTLCTHTEHL